MLSRYLCLYFKGFKINSEKEGGERETLTHHQLPSACPRQGTAPQTRTCALENWTSNSSVPGMVSGTAQLRHSNQGYFCLFQVQRRNFGRLIINSTRQKNLQVTSGNAYHWLNIYAHYTRNTFPSTKEQGTKLITKEAGEHHVARARVTNWMVSRNMSSLFLLSLMTRTSGATSYSKFLFLGSPSLAVFWPPPS